MKIPITLLFLLIFVTMGRTLLAYDEANLKQLLETNSCEHCNLRGAILRELDLTNVFLSGSNLSGADFSDSNLAGADLTDTYLYQTKFVRTELTNANFFKARITGANLTSANLHGANIFLGEKPQETPAPRRNGFLIHVEGDYPEITSFDLNQPLKYMTSKSGLLYRSKGNRYGAYVRLHPDLLAAFENTKGMTISEWGEHHWEKHGQYENRYLPTLPEFDAVLDLKNDPNFDSHQESGLLSVLSNNDYLYISYTTQEGGGDKNRFLIVDEYTHQLEKRRTFLKIRTSSSSHVAGTIESDLSGNLYLSVGVGRISDTASQSTESLVGKILRIDVPSANPRPRVIAYGLRNPWKISIDSKNRMFIGDCGDNDVESVYLLDELNPEKPYNLGWPIWEGTLRKENTPLDFEDTLAPIYEYRHHQKGACVIGGYFIDELNAYLFGDYLGRVRLLKKLEEHWQEIYIQNTPMILSFGMNANNNNIYLGGWDKVYRLVPLKEEIKRYPLIVLCDTTMPDGMLNNRDCD